VLTKELDSPGNGHLDTYLRPFVRAAATGDDLAVKITAAPGLDGNAELNKVLGKTNEPSLQARYEQQELKRTRT
jgi:cell filamentation protein